MVCMTINQAVYWLPSANNLTHSQVSGTLIYHVLPIFVLSQMFGLLIIAYDTWPGIQHMRNCSWLVRQHIQGVWQ